MAFEQGFELPKVRKDKKGKANCWKAIVAQNFQQAFEFLFGCWHRKRSRPFTLSGRTYEVCLSCGKDLTYVRVDFAPIFPKQEKETSGADSQDLIDADGEMRIDRGTWTESQPTHGNTNPTLLIQSQPGSL